MQVRRLPRLLSAPQQRIQSLSKHESTAPPPSLSPTLSPFSLLPCIPLLRRFSGDPPPPSLPMGGPQVHDVLDFLTRHGFSSAASALRDDAFSRGLDIAPVPTASVSGDGGDDSFPSLPPVRTNPSRGDVEVGGGIGAPGSTTSSSSNDFVSMGSSPYELRNPYGIWSPARTGSSTSSARHSEFGTARECNDPAYFGDAGWYVDQFGGYFNDPYLLPANSGGCWSEDKFVMSIEAEERFLKQESCSFVHGGKPDGSVRLSSAGVLGCSFPLCECCEVDGGGKIGNLNPSSSIYGKYLIMDDETERLDECEEDGAQLKRVDECIEFLPLGNDSGVLDCTRQDKGLETPYVEKNIQVLTAEEISDFTFAACDPALRQNIGMSSDHFSEVGFSKDVVSEVLGKVDDTEKPFHSEASEPEPNDGYDFGNMDGDFQGSEALRATSEDHEIMDDLQLFTAYDDDIETFDLRIIHRKNRTGFEEKKDFQIYLNSVIAGRYYLTEYVGSAAFSKVVQAHDLHTGVDVCLKIIKNDKDFFDQSLDEIKLLKYVNKNDPVDQHHILRLYDYFYYQEHLFIVCELLRANLYEFQKFNQESGGEVYFTLERIQAVARQCLEALEYLHHLKIIHCDLKPENILIKSYSRCEVKVIDLGSSCFLMDKLCLYVQSRSYRAPEIILGLPYDEKIDIWSLGCILAELYTGDVLFVNDSLVMMLARMIGILGPIDMGMLQKGQETHKYFTEDYDLYYKNEETDRIEYLIPQKSSLAHHLQVNDIAFLDFLHHLLQMDAKRRFTASQALKHRWLSMSYK